MINITNALKTIDGFGDYLLGQIINSLDFDQILEITMRKVGGK